MQYCCWFSWVVTWRSSWNLFTLLALLLGPTSGSFDTNTPKSSLIYISVIHIHKYVRLRFHPLTPPCRGFYLSFPSDASLSLAQPSTASCTLAGPPLFLYRTRSVTMQLNLLTRTIMVPFAKPTNIPLHAISSTRIKTRGAHPRWRHFCDSLVAVHYKRLLKIFVCVKYRRG